MATVWNFLPDVGFTILYAILLEIYLTVLSANYF